MQFSGKRPPSRGVGQGKGDVREDFGPRGGGAVAAQDACWDHKSGDVWGRGGSC